MNLKFYIKCKYNTKLSKVDTMYYSDNDTTTITIDLTQLELDSNKV